MMATMNAPDEARSTDRLAKLTAQIARLKAAHAAEIIRLARLDVEQEEIAAAAGLTRNTVRLRERSAGLPPRRPGMTGGRIADTPASNAA